MRCTEVEKMLSAYVNEELSPSDSQMVERHLEDCPGCSEKLADYVRVRQRMETLREGITLPDTRELIISRIKSASYYPKKQNIWKRRVLILAPISIILIAILAVLLWNPWGGSENIIAQAYSAISNVQSYRMSITKGSSGESATVTYTAEFVAPDRYHLTNVFEGKTTEFIYIADEEYFKGDYMSFLLMKLQANGFTSMITREATMRWLNMLGDIEQLPDETVEGIECYYYQGKYDVDKQVLSQQENREKMGLPPLSEDDLQEMREEMHAVNDSMKFELWIGKTDYLMRQWRVSREEQTDTGIMNSHTTYKFYDFNESIIIEAPMDSSGILLTGWTTTSPDQPTLSKEIQSSIDHSDPSIRKINYIVSIRNISSETVTGIDIDIITAPPPFNSEGPSIWIRQGKINEPVPESLKPGESFEYEITFGYDATRVSPDEIVEAITSSVFYIGYINSSGEQKAEKSRFEVPDSIYTITAITIPTYELEPVGEYRVNEAGASFASGDIIGEIGGKKYLFVLVGTQNSDTQEEPGLLILNIQNPEKPVKVSYLEAPEGAWFTMDSALSDTTIYVTTSDFLWIVDVSNPIKPRELTKFEGTFNHIVISGDYAFFARYNSITALNISNPSYPVVAGNLDLTTESSILLYTAGNYLLAWGKNALHTIDISSPFSMTVVNSYIFSFPLDSESTESATPASVGDRKIEGNYAYAVLRCENETGIMLLDITNPPSPREISFLNLNERDILMLCASGNRLYMFTRPEFTIGMRMRLDIIDVSDLTSPFEIGSVTLPNDWEFFESVQGGGTESYSFVDKFFYWFIGKSPNQPVIEIFDLSNF